MRNLLAGLTVAFALAPVDARADDKADAELLLQLQQSQSDPSSADAVAKAQEMLKDPATAEALRKTQELLNDPSLRNDAIQKSSAARQADSNVSAVAKTDADKQAIYELSASVMKTLTEASGGDADKMAKMMEDAKTNPEAFAQKLTPEQRASLEKIAKQIEGPATSTAPNKPAAPKQATPPPAPPKQDTEPVWQYSQTKP